MGLTDAGLTVERDDGQVTDQPPTISSTPTPSFEEGTGSTYDFTANVSDDGLSAVTYSLTNVLPNGLTLNTSTGILTYDGIGAASVSQHQLTATDAVGSAQSNSFDVSITGLPLSATMESVPSELQPLHIFFPRPDSETNTWARHRKTYPGIPYRIGVTPCYGRPPYYFQLIAGPTGMTIGNFLVDDGTGTGRFEDDGDYGVVEWTNPTATGMPGGGWVVTVRVFDQSGTFTDITWDLIVETTGFLFINSATGNNANDGTLNSPMFDNEGWHTYNGFVVDNQYAGYHVIYRGGTHNMKPVNDPGVKSFAWQLDETDVPLVHYGYHGEAVILDFTDIMCQFNGGRGTGNDSQDAYFAHMTIQNNHQVNSPRFFEILETDVGTPEVYDGTGDHQRMTWFDIKWGSFTGDGLDLNNNTAYIWAEQAATGGGTGRVRHYIVLRNCDSDGFDMTGNTTGFEVNANMVYIGSVRFACWWGGTVTNFVGDGSRGIFLAKAGGCRFFAFLLDASAASNSNTTSFTSHNTDFDTAYGYREDWGYNEWAYCKGKRTHIAGTAHDETDPNVNVGGNNEGPDRMTRCTMSAAAGDAALAIGNQQDWPNEIKGAVFVSDQTPFYSQASNHFAPDGPETPDGWKDYLISATPLDSSMNFTSGNSALRGEWGAEIFKDIGGL